MTPRDTLKGVEQEELGVKIQKAQPITLEQIRNAIEQTAKQLRKLQSEYKVWQSILEIRTSQGSTRSRDRSSVNKSEMLRNFLKSRRMGTTYEKVREHFSSKHVTLRTNLIYNQIGKWKKANVVKVKGGKIFWTQT